MKKVFRNSRLIAVAFLTIFSASAKSNDTTTYNPGVSAVLKFAGLVKNNPVFELNVAGNTGENDYVISITDIYGNMIYNEKIKAETFTKRFLLDAEELGDEKLYFKILNKKTAKTVVYEIGSNTTYTSETTVNLVQ